MAVPATAASCMSANDQLILQLSVHQNSEAEDGAHALSTTNALCAMAKGSDLQAPAAGHDLAPTPYDYGKETAGWNSKPNKWYPKPIDPGVRDGTERYPEETPKRTGKKTGKTCKQISVV